MEELRIKIINSCNESELPLEAVLFVVRDVYRDVVESWNMEKARRNNISENEESVDSEE